jgi:hypothetical protein
MTVSDQQSPIACLTRQHTSAPIHAKPAGAGPPADMSPSGPDPAALRTGLAKRQRDAMAALETAGHHPLARPCARKGPKGGLGKTGQQHRAGCDSQGRQVGECVVASGKLASGTQSEIGSAQRQAVTERSLCTGPAIGRS